MSAITSLKTFKENAKNEPVTEETTAVMQTITDKDVMQPEEIEEIKQVYEVFGAEYKGKSFEVYATKNGEYNVSLPRIYSNGKNAVVNFGGEEVVISDKQKVNKDARYRSGSKGSYLLYKKAGLFELPVYLVPDVAGAEKPTYANAENVIDEEDATWGSVVGVLFGIYPRAKTDDLKMGFVLNQVDRVEAKDDEGKIKAYYKAVVLTPQRLFFSCFLPDVEGVAFKVGDAISYDNIFKHEPSGKTFNIGMKFEKLANLASGEYTVVKVEESKGDFPGVNFTLSDGRVVSGNAKMKSWATSLASFGDVSGSNPAVLTIGAKNTLKNGKTQVITFLKMKAASSGLLGSLLNRGGDRTEPTAMASVSVKAEPVTTGTQLEVASVPTPPAQLAEDEDPWAAIPV